MIEKDKSAEYIEILQPLVDALADACEKLDVPYVTMVQLDSNRVRAALSKESMVMGSYHIVKDHENITSPIAQAIKHLLPDDIKPTDTSKLN